MSVTATLYRVRMKLTKAFGHARASRDESDDLILVVEQDGIVGVGECVPRDYVTGESVDIAIASLRRLDLDEIARASAGSFAVAVGALEALALPARLATANRPGLAAACAVELALLDIVGKHAGLPLHASAEVLGVPSRDSARPIRLTRAIDFNLKPAELLAAPFQPDHIKLKGGTEASYDLDRVRTVRELFGDRVTLSIDANMAWSLDDAIARVELLRPYAIAWYEEPLAQYALADYHTLRARTGARVMLDESLCSFHDAQRAIEAGACDLFNIRISKNGGLLGSLRLAELADRHGLGIQLGVHPGQTGVLGAAGAHFLRTVDGIATCEGGGTWIGTGGLPERTIVEELALDATTGRVHGLGATGLGVTPNLDVIERYATETYRFRDGRWS
jgi:muconate cycloisomerase